MVLVTAMGWLLSSRFGVDGGVLLGLILGLVLAQLVPAASCAVPRRDQSDADRR